MSQNGACRAITQVVNWLLTSHASGCSLYCIRQFASSAFHGIQELETQTEMTEKILSALKLNETL